MILNLSVSNEGQISVIIIHIPSYKLVRMNCVVIRKFIELQHDAEHMLSACVSYVD